jgi:hypothetical protein
MANWTKRWFWEEVGSNFQQWWRDPRGILFRVFFWITTGLLVALYTLGFFFPPEPATRTVGVLLQFSGFLCVAYGLEKTLGEFGREPSLQRVFSWMMEFGDVFQTNRGISLSGQGVGISPEGSAALTVRSPPEPPQSIAKRLRQLEGKVKELKEELNGVREELGEEVSRLEDLIEEKKEALMEEIEQVEEKVEEVNVGELTLGLEWWGVSLLIYGLVLSSFPWFFQPVATVLLIPVLISGGVGALVWGFPA